MVARTEADPIARLSESIAAWHSLVPPTIETISQAAAAALRDDVRTLPQAVEAAATTVLSGQSRFAGAGIVSVHPRVLATSRPLLWWVLQDTRLGRVPRPLDADLTELGSYQAGLEEAEWYRVPATEGIAHMTGPYVDYMCTDEFALTFTSPLTVDGDVIGVAGLDVTVRSVEADIEGPLEDIGAGSLFLAGDDLVVLSLDPRYATGRRLSAELLRGYDIVGLTGTRFSVAVPRA